MHYHRRISISLVVIITTVAGIFAGISSLQPAHAALPNPTSCATKAPIPFLTGQAAVAGGVDGRIYVIGGSSGGSPVSTARAYNPRDNSWTSCGSEGISTTGSAVGV